jgi:hypothetical protein
MRHLIEDHKETDVNWIVENLGLNEASLTTKYKRS